MDKKQIRVTGFVQGVGFRWFASRTARAMGLRGWVRNLPGGGVEIFAAGEKSKVSEFIQYLYGGPGEVSDVSAAPSVEEPPAGFDIRF